METIDIEVTLASELTFQLKKSYDSRLEGYNGRKRDRSFAQLNASPAMHRSSY